MRFRFCISILLVALIAGCGSKDDVVVDVNINSPDKNVLYLNRIDFNQIFKVDSVKISKGENHKRFRIKQGDEPEFYSIGTKDGKAVTILASKGERIKLTLDLNNILSYQVEGSEGSSKVKEVVLAFAKSKAKVDVLSNRYLSSDSPEEREALNKEFDAERKRIKDELTKFIWDNPMSKASIMALYLKYNDNIYVFDSSDDLLLIKMVASAWKALYPKSNYTKGMLEDIKSIEKKITNAKFQQMIQNAEMPIPDLSISDRHGKKITLSSLKGKVVLLDFFTSENTVSLLDNRELMEIYKKYKSKGFEVYQISYDSTKEAWLNYLNSSNIPWISVREEDPKKSQAAIFYNVKQIPANYLIGKDFNIIGKNLYGKELQKALNEYLNH
ncbi:TlpA family protein disulfide reductase [Tenuifilum thalassicum]|uniref:AhpC/TSA family protein n=1 Tax=Tenuifilum thalassicum TaxID=2590900 RepID=A0A7D3XYM1_9BACT|nr:TlpA disulfide reductase family protein [Tenuifilum thalassicum]QKG79293.1 AhpC/TSA family protein [Tenuifilum thalassicum]